MVGVLGIDDIVQDEARRGAHPGGRPGEAHRLGVIVAGDPRVEAVVGEHEVDEPGRCVGDQRSDVR